MIPICTLLAVASALQPNASDEVLLTWSAPSGTTLERTWMTGHLLFVDTVRRNDSGKIIPTGKRWSITTERSLTFIDEYRRVSPGRPLEVRRVYDQGELKARVQEIGEESEAQPADLTLKSAVTGRSVIWTWVPQEDGYGRYWDGVEAQEAWLSRMQGDLDLSFLLPEGPVAPGAQWEVAPETMRALLDPGGDVRFEDQKGYGVIQRTLGFGIGGGLHRVFGGLCSGSVSVELKAVEGKLATLALRLERVRFVRDANMYSLEHILRREELADLKVDNARLVLEFTGTGSLVWDLEQGRAVSLNLDVGEKVESRISMKGLEDRTVQEDLHMSGTFRARYTAAPFDPNAPRKVQKPPGEPAGPKRQGPPRKDGE